MYPIHCLKQNTTHSRTQQLYLFIKIVTGATDCQYRQGWYYCYTQFTNFHSRIRKSRRIAI